MRPDLQRLKRRPFLMPLVMPLVLLGVAVLSVLWLMDARTSTVVIAVRHAQLADNKDNPNPELSAIGKQRAAALVDALRLAKPERGVDAIYVAADAASQQTAAPLAQTMGLAVNVIPDGDWRALARRIAGNHPGEVVLVVADLAELTTLLHQYPDSKLVAPEADDFTAMYVISASRLSKSSVIRLRY